MIPAARRPGSLRWLGFLDAAHRARVPRSATA